MGRSSGGAADVSKVHGAQYSTVQYSIVQYSAQYTRIRGTIVMQQSEVQRPDISGARLRCREAEPGH